MPWVTNPYARSRGTAAAAAASSSAAVVSNPNHHHQQQPNPNPTPWTDSFSRGVDGPPHPRPGSSPAVPFTEHSWTATPPAFVPWHPADGEQQQQQQSNVLARPVSMDEDRMANPYDDDETTTTRRGRTNQRTNPYAQRPVVVAPPRASTIPTLSSSLGNRTNTTIQPVDAFQLLQHERAQRQADPLFLLSLDHRNTNNTNSSSYEWLQLHPGVHELCGPAGSGKTQLALSCCRQAAAAACHRNDNNNNNNNNNRTGCSSSDADTAVRALYICLSGSPQASVSQVARRLRQMCHHDDDAHILQRIGTRGCTTPDDLLELLRDTIPRQRRTASSSSSTTSSTTSTTATSFAQLRLIVLDSIANLVREDRDIPARSAWLFQVAAALQDLVWDAATTTAPPLSILVLNQVTADWTSSSSSSSWWDPNNNHLHPQHYQRREDAWIPALGLSWAHCVHSHFQLDRQPQQQQALPCDSDHPSSSTTTTTRSRTVRRLWLAHSARHAAGDGAAVSFVITPAGCQLLVCDNNNNNNDKNTTAAVPTTRPPPTQTN